jgi:tetratricopeptide (TPR) repeat protein
MGGVLLIAAAPLLADQKPWTEIRSPHFVVLTNGTAGDGRRVAKEFEQMRGVFAAAFPNMRLETSAPLLIFAPRDGHSMMELTPSQWKGHSPNIAGNFRPGWEKSFAMVRLDADRPGSYQVVYHEYVHSLLHANFRWLPTWLNEGLAEFYGSSRFEDSKIYVGALGDRTGRVRNALLIPIEKLISENPYKEYRGDDRMIDRFYGESELLVHYFMFGEGMERGAKLSQFYSKLQQGKDQKSAFQESFGDFKSVEKNFYHYIQSFQFGSAVMNNPGQLSPQDFAVRELSVAETETAIAGFRIWAHDIQDAREITEQALKSGPQVAEAHEYQGFVLLGEGKDAEAAAEFARAHELDERNYLALYFKIILSPLFGSNADADQAAFREAMLQVVKLNPKFAPAFVELAMLYIRWGEFDNALSNARTAENLEPSRAGYHLLVAKILERMGKGPQAAKIAQYVAERWTGPDHDEAVELWNRILAADRPAGVALSEEAEHDAQRTEGTIRSVACKDSGRMAALTMERGSKLFTYRVGSGFPSGFSDTVWFGSDHFQMCHHLEGMRAVVFFKPSAEKEFAGDIAKLEIREDLPASPEAKPSKSAAAAPNKNN